ncbi:hypothetical protein [Mycoplasma sp. 3686d]|uniref:hypothetical protein n=1 Tax=Mycoplasma sp. 3686d TaxID=2967300 RepID=UPI00211B993A|nr:hypothetical protein [Mycoplasma sp. 3686d]UUM24459.1 hypothetical protein NPA12_02030 [Mycoplasma sp. 3686d]
MKLKKRLFVASLSLGVLPFLGIACNTTQTNKENPSSPTKTPSTSTETTTTKKQETLKQVITTQATTVTPTDNLTANKIDAEQKKVVDRYKKLVKEAKKLSSDSDSELDRLERLSYYLAFTEDENHFFSNVNTIRNFFESFSTRDENAQIETKEQYQFYGLDLFVQSEAKLNKALKEISGLTEFDSPETSPLVASASSLDKIKTEVEALKAEVDKFTNLSTDAQGLANKADSEYQVYLNLENPTYPKAKSAEELLKEVEDEKKKQKQTTSNKKSKQKTRKKRDVSTNSGSQKKVIPFEYISPLLPAKLDKDKFENRHKFVMALVRAAHQYNEAKKQAAYETKYSGLTEEQRSTVLSLKHYLELTKNDQDGSKKINSLKLLISAVFNENEDRDKKYPLNQENKDMQEVAEFYKFINSKATAVDVKNNDEYTAAKLNELNDKVTKYTQVLKKVYNLYFDYNIERLSTAYENKKTSSDLMQKVKERIDKYTTYRHLDIFSNLGMTALANEKAKLDVYYDQLVTLNNASTSTSDSAVEELFSSVSDPEYYKNEGAEKTTVFLMLSNLERFDALFKTFEGSNKTILDGLKGQANQLLPFVSDINGEQNAAFLNQEFGNHFTVSPFDKTKLEKDLKDVKALYTKAQELYKQLKEADTIEKLTEFANKFNDKTNGFAQVKKVYDQALEDLKNAEQNVRKQIIMNNKASFEQESEDFLDLYSENVSSNDSAVTKAFNQANNIRFALSALYVDKDVNKDDQNNRKAQLELAQAYINLVGPALSTPLKPQDNLGYDRIITLKTDIDKVWFYSESLRTRWEQVYKAYMDAVNAAKAKESTPTTTTR